LLKYTSSLKPFSSKRTPRRMVSRNVRRW